MLSDSSLAVLKRLLDTPGPSGFEAAPARVWREEASAFAEVSSDVVGNSYAIVNPGGSPTIMLAGHIDEIGVIVTYMDDNGFVYIAGIGGWDPQVLVGQRIRFLGTSGDVIGVVGKKPIHLMKKPEEREKATRMTDLWVDIGARSRVEAEERLRIGDAGVIDAAAIELPNRRLVSRSIDNRMGAFIVLEAARRYAETAGNARVVAVATTQEEIAYAHGGGALTGANRLNPAMAIVVDVSFSSDHPGLEKKELGDHRIGGGPILPRGSIISPVVFELLRNTASQLGIPHTVRAMPRETSTDADAIAMAREGIAIGLVDIPNRYMHSPNELVSLDDLDRAAALIAEICRRVDNATDFAAR
ncbi:MAG TPA: M20/M25/M40 family metallo-hydrolase [Gemmatimonadales bacterium]|nr:M20/M25/M40 family metallo-hydrolase [Gemmatimonadales bacterium]